MRFYDDNEQELIKESIRKGHESWVDKNLDEIKKKIKLYHFNKQNHKCCYCRIDLYRSASVTIDIEHILPKHLYVNEMFQIENLSCSCKVCNLYRKGKKIDFYIASNNQMYASESYKFIHPNFDVYHDYINYISMQVNNTSIWYYQVIDNRPKGIYTKDFFKLENSSINSFNESQGVSSFIGIDNQDVRRAFERLINDFDLNGDGKI